MEVYPGKENLVSRAKLERKKIKKLYDAAKDVSRKRETSFLILYGSNVRVVYLFAVNKIRLLQYPSTKSLK